MTRHFEFIRFADQSITFQFADGETLEDSPITYINDADVRAYLYNETGALAKNSDGGNSIDGLLLEYETSTDGFYRGVVETTGPESPSGVFDPPCGVGYRLRIVVETPAGANRTFNFPASVIDG